MDRRSGMTIQAALLAPVIVLGAGCTTTPETESMRAMVEEARQEAAEARAAALQAQKTADKAQSTADRALRSAESASKCCTDTNEKIDRMFKRSMYK